MATKGPINPVVDPMIDPETGEYAVIAPGHSFKSVTQKIAGIVLTSNTPLGWFFGLVFAQQRTHRIAKPIHEQDQGECNNQD